MASSPRGYSANHHRVYRSRGKARNYPCLRGCGRQATQWAHLHNTDATDPNNYEPLCRSCHAKYDGAIPPSQVGKKPVNAMFSDEQAEIIRTRVASGETQKLLAVEYGCNPMTIGRIVRREHYNRSNGREWS